MADHSPRHLILSLFGLYGRGETNGLTVRSLIALMEDLEVDAAATRSSVSRLKKRGVLVSARSDGQAGYALSPTALAVLREGDARIWSRLRGVRPDAHRLAPPSLPRPRDPARAPSRRLAGREGGRPVRHPRRPAAHSRREARARASRLTTVDPAV